MKRGFAGIYFLILAGVAVIALVVAFFLLNPKTQEQGQITQPKTSSTPAKPATTSTQKDEKTGWKTYKSKDDLYKISYPSEWKVNEQTSPVSLGRNRIEVAIIVWSNGSKEYAEQQWQSIDCALDGPPEVGCAPLHNKELKKLSTGNNTVYWKIDGRDQMHAFVPNQSKNKTVEIYTVYLQDQNLFNQILSTFQFID